MNVPVLGKAVALSNLSSIAIAVCSIVSFDECGIDGVADSNCYQLIVKHLCVFASGKAIPCYRVSMYACKTAGLTHTTTFRDML